MRKIAGPIVAIVSGMILAGCGLLEQPPLFPPSSPPADLAASFGEGESKIILTWRAVEGASFYEIARAQAPDGEYQLIGTTSSTSFVDEVEEGKWYWYRVRACNAAGRGPWSEPARGYAGHPPAPQNVQASDGVYPDKIVVAWEAIPGASYYQLFRDPGASQNCQGLCYLKEVEGPPYEDREVRVGLIYRYAVRACNGHGCSELSPTDTGCVQPCPTPFSADEGKP